MLQHRGTLRTLCKVKEAVTKDHTVCNATCMNYTEQANLWRQSRLVVP